MGQRVRKQILGDTEKAKYFSIIFDSTPDISHQDEKMTWERWRSKNHYWISSP